MNATIHAGYSSFLNPTGKVLSIRLGDNLVSRRFSLYDIEEFIREAGAERVTEDAVAELERELNRLAERMTDRAIVYARHAKRSKIIKRTDIVLTGPQYSTEADRIKT